jgi:AcrR family transcriptional regulator
MAKGRPREFDKDKALDAALALFWRHGYEGTSTARLADAMGIAMPSLYAAFGSKEGLFLAAVERYGRQAAPVYEGSLSKPTAREVARSVLEAEVDLVTQKDWPNGCLMVQGALVASPESEKLSDTMAGMRATAEGWLEARFRKAKSEGDLPPDSDPKALACYIMTVNSGLAVQARTGAARRQLMKVVDLAMANWPEGTRR